jgi:hypothetical protein
MSQKTIPRDLTSASTTPRFPLGTVVTTDTGETYVYVKVYGSGATANAPAYASAGAGSSITKSKWIVTPSSADGKLPVGYFVGSPADGSYAWIKIRGEVTLTNNGASGAGPGVAVYFVKPAGSAPQHVTAINPPSSGASTVIGFLLDTVTPNGSGRVWISLPFVKQER